MNYKVVSTSRFRKESKRLIKKYPSLKSETLNIIQILKANPSLGIGIGSNAFKVRVGIKSKGSGKSGGGRIITYLVDKAGEIYLLSIYDKSEKETVTDKELKQMIKEIDL